jgi:hypothetical protein
MRQRVTAVLAGAVLATILSVAGPIALVRACSCAELQPNQALQMADVAFVGVVARVADPSAGNPMVSSAEPIFYTFAVERAQKQVGETSTIQVSSARDGASCGQAFAVGQRWQLYAYRDGATLSTGICSGNQMLAEGVAIPELEESEPQAPPAGVLIALVVALLVAGASIWAFTRRGCDALA